jgi:hypothetical protein
MGAEEVRLFLLIVILLGGCSIKPRAVIVNETGVPIGVHVDGRKDLVGWQNKVIALAPGKRLTLWYEVVVNPGARVTLRLGGCDFTYEEPYRKVHERSGLADIIGALIRRVSDGTLYLVPLAARDGPAGKFEFEALDEHPLQPIARMCS